MTRHIYLILILTIELFSCSSQNSNLTKVTLATKNDFQLDSNLKFQHCYIFPNSFSYAYPKTFIQQFDTVKIYDSFVCFPKDKEAILIFFVEGKIKNQDTSKNYLYEYFQKLETGQHSILQNCKIINSQIQYHKKWTNYRGYFVANGQINDKQFIWKTYLSEVFELEDLTFKTMLFIYPIEKQSYFQPIGDTLANSFIDPIYQHIQINDIK